MARPDKSQGGLLLGKSEKKKALHMSHRIVLTNPKAASMQVEGAE
jgi:hypothetical protein